MVLSGNSCTVSVLHAGLAIFLIDVEDDDAADAILLVWTDTAACGSAVVLHVLLEDEDFGP